MTNLWMAHPRAQPASNQQCNHRPTAFNRAILSSPRCKFDPKPLEFALFFEPVSVREQNRRITHYEANISAERSQASSHSRIPRADVYQGRPTGAQATSRKGSSAAVGLRTRRSIAFRCKALWQLRAFPKLRACLMLPTTALSSIRPTSRFPVATF